MNQRSVHVGHTVASPFQHRQGSRLHVQSNGGQLVSVTPDVQHLFPQAERGDRSPDTTIWRLKGRIIILSTAPPTNGGGWQGPLYRKLSQSPPVAPPHRSPAGGGGPPSRAHKGPRHLCLRLSRFHARSGCV